MSGQHYISPEPESEDGGVALGLLESSDDVETEDESAPTSASTSPVQSPTNFANTLHTLSLPISQAVLPSVSREAEATERDAPHEQSRVLPAWSSLQSNLPHVPSTGLMWQTADATFAEALSGELLNVPEIPEPHEEDFIAERESGSFGTPQTFSLSTTTLADSSSMHEGESALQAYGGEMWNGTDLAALNIDRSLLGNVQRSDTNVSLPSLAEVFGSGFLTQTAGPFQGHVSDTPASLDILEDEADFWEDLEDSMRNFSCDSFFKYWKQMYAHGINGYPPISGLANKQRKISPRDGDERPDRIFAKDIEPGTFLLHDFQGIYWSRFQSSKEDARAVRRITYSNHVNDCNENSDSAGYVSNIGPFGSPDYTAKFSEVSIPCIDRHFQFREMNTRLQSYISHFQLRHNLFASSKNALFYIHRPRKGYGYGAHVDLSHGCDAKIKCFNPETSADECVMDFSKGVDADGVKTFRPSTLTAAKGILVVGSHEGAYAMKSLSADFKTAPTAGIVTNNGYNGSTNHIHNFLDRRSGLPQAVFSSNDKTVRTLDCTTNQFVSTHRFPYAVNCSATNPDGRLQLLVGDGCLPIVANAETGEMIAELPDHTNYGFACDWAPDGITMATGHQDGFVQVWDARNFSRSIQAIPMEMAGCRTLQFSPAGSGKRVLVIAEPADFVHVVDARTFQSKQVIDFFGEIAGISMPPDGSSLYVANQDSTYGGLMEFERDFSVDLQDDSRSRRRKFRIFEHENSATYTTDQMKQTSSAGRIEGKDFAWHWLELDAQKRPPFDWLPESDLDDDDRSLFSKTQRNRQLLKLEEVII